VARCDQRNWVEVADDLRAVIDAALQAPSGDNVQPWRIAMAARGFNVSYDEQREHIPLDPSGVMTRFALGCLLENAAVQASALGRALDIALDADSPVEWARVALGAPGSAPVADAELAQVIFRRCSNRLRFRGALTDQEIAALAAEARSGVIVRVIGDSSALREAARIIGAAEGLTPRVRASHEYLHRWLRWSPEAAEASCDGLDVRTLELSWGQRVLMRLLRPWMLMRVAVRFGASIAYGAHARRLVGGSGALGVIAVPELTRASACDAGRLTERIWLRLTALGLQSSPFASQPLAAQHVRVGGKLFTNADERRIRALEQRLEQVAELPPGSHSVMLFRIGRAEAPSVRSLRRPLVELPSASST
jgi:hypothetical protein